MEFRYFSVVITTQQQETIAVTGNRFAEVKGESRPSFIEMQSKVVGPPCRKRQFPNLRICGEVANSRTFTAMNGAAFTPEIALRFMRLHSKGLL